MIIPVLLCGCTNAPSESVIASKAGGNFERKMYISSDEQHDPNKEVPLILTDSFSSTDNTVDFSVKINTSIKDCDMPVVEVVPHYLTEADARRVAEVLFGNVDYYEKKPILAENFSKKEIQEKLNRWTQYANDESIYDLYGQEPDFILGVVKDSIAYYTAELDVAPNNETDSKCQWRFKDEAYYTYSSEDIESGEELLGNDAIMATCKIGDVPYSYKAITRNRNDYKLNMISVHLYDGTSPMGLDERIFTAHLCRTDKPTERQISEIGKKARQILKNINLGSWEITQCTVQTTYYGDCPEYMVHINATPLLCNVAAAQQPELYNLNNDSLYASNYYMTNTSMNFSATGEIIDFEMTSPIEIKDVINGNVATIAISELFDVAKNHLILSDSHTYGVGNLSQIVDEKIQCSVNITDLYYNLLRIRVPNTDDAYYYVPGIVIVGYTEGTGADSGNLYYSSNESQILLAVNAVDATIIELTNAEGS